MTRPPPTRRSLLRGTVGLGLLVGFAASIPLWITGAGLAEPYPIPLGALLLLAAKPLIERLARGEAGGRARVLIALLLATPAPVLAIGADAVLGYPLVKNPRLGEPPGLDGALVFIALLLAVPALASPVIAAIAGRSRPLVDRAVGGAAVLAIAASALLVAASGARALGAPEPSRYVASLPLAGEMPDATSGSRAPEVLRLGELAIRRTCAEGMCDVEVLGPEGTIPAWAPRIVPLLKGGAAVEARFEDAPRVWFLRVAGREPIAFGGDAFDLVQVTPESVAEAVSPPLSWIIVAALGLAAAFAALAPNLRHLGAMRRLALAKEGVLGEGGWIHFEGGAPPMRAPAEGLPPGPVVVIPLARGPAAVYRAHAPLGEASVVTGTQLEGLDVVRTRITEAYALALAATSLTAAPLLAAALRGLVF